MRSPLEEAQRSSRLLDRRIPAFVNLAKFTLIATAPSILKHNKAANMAKNCAALTGPVTTLLDLVVHVPVSCGSVCADTKDRSTALAVSDDRSNTIMKCGRCKAGKLVEASMEEIELMNNIFRACMKGKRYRRIRSFNLHY